MKNIGVVFIYGILLFASCKQPIKQEEKIFNTDSVATQKSTNLIGKPIFLADSIIEPFSKFWKYYSENIQLYKDFKAVDINGKPITRTVLLEKLTTGLYFPLALYANGDTLSYQLAVLPKKADKNISAYMQQFSKEQLAFCKLEGKPVPAFDFKDVNGIHYTSENIKGKIVLFKCWFISCLPCRQEMPALNEIVKKYRDRKDILFISLATDNKKELQQFLSTTKFEYATVSNQAKYMANQLHVVGYPTHFIINKKGELVRMLPDVLSVEEAIEKELAK
ncbi:TlpA family protein disulfide reductase [Pedobacter boryungensis]|uniref:TlpA family protein disulfide reductase n=1 Tax=Pedobacter boryungensis TaxID=869962 RepID=A0ABX2DAW7_9SPHI|nr:TlpA disulfide reductase family protein [Pedobacter boryungensis]NQX30334.1 TlpA family protein disulfide reductase [Pedobacter boryungensis]